MNLFLSSLSPILIMRRQHLRNKAFTIFENPLLMHAALEDRMIELLKILTNVGSKEDKYLGRNIFGRQTYNGSNDGTNYYIQKQCNLPPPAYGLCFKLEMSIMNLVQEID